MWEFFALFFTLPFSFPSPISSRLVAIALQNFEYPWDVPTRMFLLPCLLNVFQVLFKNVIQRSVLRQDSYEYQEVWEDMGRHLKQWAPPMLCNFTPEQMQNPKRLAECLKKVCHYLGNCKETQITEMCWDLASTYQTAVNTTATPVTGLVVTSTAPKAGQENQPVSVAVATICKMKQWIRKSGGLESKGSPSQTKEEEDEAGYSKVSGPSEKQEDEENDIIKA